MDPQKQPKLYKMPNEQKSGCRQMSTNGLIIHYKPIENYDFVPLSPEERISVLFMICGACGANAVSSVTDRNDQQKQDSVFNRQLLVIGHTHTCNAARAIND